MKRRILSLPLVTIATATGAAWCQQASVPARPAETVVREQQAGPDDSVHDRFAEEAVVMAAADSLVSSDLHERDDVSEETYLRGGSVWYVDDDAAGGGDGTSWNTAFKYLQDAFSAAAGGSEIRVAGGTYKPDEDEAGNVTPGERTETFQLISGVGVYGGHRGLAGGGDPDDRDITTYETILSGDLAGNDGPDFANNEENSQNVVKANGTQPTTRLDGVTVSGGFAQGASGGGMQVSGSSSVTLTDCTFVGNRADWEGGGIHGGWDADTTIVLTDCAFSQNDGGWGGGAIMNAANMTLTNCVFSGNTADNGGGILCDGEGGGSTTLVNCVFDGNIAQDEGGAVRSWYGGTSACVNCTFRGNTAQFGGGIYNFEGDLDLINCTFANNYAYIGSGMSNDGSSPLLINCSFLGSQSGYMTGGMYNANSSPLLINCTFVGNSSGDFGGGAMVNELDSDPTLVNCTFTKNAPWGGQVYNSADSQPTVTNCIFWGGDLSFEGDGVPIVTYSDVEGGHAGAGNIDLDPLFLRNPDGGDDGFGDNRFTPGIDESANDDYGDLRLQTGSPCNDAGDNTAVPPDLADLDGDGDTGEPTPLDLNGMPRFADDPLAPDNGVPSEILEIVDMGAYENQGVGEGIGLAGIIDPPVFTCQGGTCRCEFGSDAKCEDHFWVGPPTCGSDVDCEISAEEPNSYVVVGESELPKAFYYPGDDEWYAIESGVLTISWGNAAGEPVALVDYAIAGEAADRDDVFETAYFIDALPYAGTAAIVAASQAYTTVIRYNSVIRENAGLPLGADIGITGLAPNLFFQIRIGCPPGMVVLQYIDGAPPDNPTVGFEVLLLKNAGFIADNPAPVGRRIAPPAESDEICGTAFVNNTIAGGDPVAWARTELGGSTLFQTTDVWPMRPSSVPSRLQILWYKRSANEHIDLETCWPVRITKHSSEWPSDSQINVIDENDPAAGPTVKLKVGNNPDLGDRYCKAYRVYQEGFDGTGSLAHANPGEDLGETFAAQTKGYSVIRFLSDPGGVGSGCGDVVTFEVVATYDHRDTVANPGYPHDDGAPVYDGAPELQDIGVSLEKPDEHDSDTPLYPYGYLHSGLPYADSMYDGELATGQVIAVNRSAMYGSVEDGEPEVWYFQPAREKVFDGEEEEKDTTSGDFAEGIYWPHKVFRYDVDWPNITNRIVIENRNGAECLGDACQADGGYPPLAKVYDKGAYTTRNADKTTVVGWNANDEHARLISVSGGVLKAFAVRDDDPWGVNDGYPYALVYYPVEPTNPQSADEVTKWAMGAHEVIASDSDPVCAWDGTNADTFACFVYEGFQDVDPANVVYAGAPITPPLFPVNYWAELCVDENFKPMTYVDNAPGAPPTALWADRTGLVWAVEDHTDGRDMSFPEGTESSSQIYLWENWVADDLDGEDGTCDPWRDFGTGKPSPIRYTPAWPHVPPDDCNWEAGDENCARPVYIGNTVAHGVNAQCGTIKFLHDSVNAVVIDPLECSAVHFPNELVLSQLDFADLPPHLGGGEFSGGGFKVPARVEYVTGGVPLKLHEDAKCGDFLSEKLLFVGIMTDRDRFFMLRMGGLIRDDCYDENGLKIDAEAYCVAVDDLYNLSREQLGTRCLGGSTDGEACTPANPVCVGGDMDGTTCTTEGSNDCRPGDGACTSGTCDGGTENGEACTSDDDCVSDADSVCVGPCPAACRPQCVGGIQEGEECTLGGRECDPPDGECDSGTCLGGTKAGDSCTNDDQCLSEPDSQCAELCPPGECRMFTQERPHVISLAGAEAKEGWLTVAFQNDGYCKAEGAPVAVEVWRVNCGPERGRVNVIEAECPFSEAVVLQHNGDAGGEPENLSYEWQVSTDYRYGQDPESATWDTYPASGLGARETVLDGSLDPVYTLMDSWWRVRYRGYKGCKCGGDREPACPDDWPQFLHDQAPELADKAVSEFTKPALCEGWIKRVVRKFNAFDQRIEEFHTTAIATYVNMIRQAGIRYEGPVALNCSPENINSLGLIETYATVLARARQFLGGAGLAVTPDPANLALLLAASKISDLYMLLGNEGFADALDPTIGLFPMEGEVPPPSAPTSIFCFQGQLPDLLAEELAMLRGLDRIRDLDVDPTTGDIAATVYNRLPWNFTSTDGQIAYANNYQVTAIIDATREDGAMIRYPQGHGDAWGHYLTATMEFYKLLTSEFFNWVVSTEAVNIAGQAVAVTFEYERKFAAAAAAKARTGAAVTSMTFRQHYSAAPGQKHGYPDNDPDRRWGVADWGRRAGQAAYLDWVIVNSLLDDEDTEHEEGSIQKVDRTTVADIGEISTAFAEIQSVLDNADADLNPLGLATNVVPFGVNPSAIEEGTMHFDQANDRAVWALANAIRVFEYANLNDQRLRSVQDSAVAFDELVDEAETDFAARLIEIFGRPYPEDIGPGGLYPAGYDGPDLLHFAYVEPSALLSQDEVNLDGNALTVTWDMPWAEIKGDSEGLLADACAGFPDGSVCIGTIQAQFNHSTDGLGLIKPAGWSEQRIEPGEIQLGRSELLQSYGEYMQALARYEEQLVNIDVQLSQVEQTTNVTRGSMAARWAVVETTLAAC